MVNIGIEDTVPCWRDPQECDAMSVVVKKALIVGTDRKNLVNSHRNTGKQTCRKQRRITTK